MTENEFLFALFKAVEVNNKVGVLVDNYIKEHQFELDDETKRLLSQFTNDALARD